MLGSAPLAAPRRDAYLARLGLADDPSVRRVTVAAMRRLHAAHVERVAYESIDPYCGVMVSIEPAASVDRILAGRGGYCFALNGAFGLLLESLGFAVTPHRAGVQMPGQRPAVDNNHLALTVESLPDDANPGGVWWVDVGLGDALHEPVPLVTGEHRQGPFRYGLSSSLVAAGGWRLEHDRRGVFVGVDVAAEAAELTDFTAQHVFYSTAEASPYRAVLSIQRRDATGVDMLTGLELLRRHATGDDRRLLAGRDEWLTTVRSVFGIDVASLGERRSDELWRRIAEQHEAWLATREDISPDLTDSHPDVAPLRHEGSSPTGAASTRW